MTSAETKTTGSTPPLNEVPGPALGQEAISNYVLRYGDGLVPSLCQGILADRGFNRLPILADALEEAGYANNRILSFLRGTPPEKYLIPETVLEVIELFRSLGGCYEEATSGYLEHLQPITKLPAAQLKAQMDFMENYNVQIIGESKIELTLKAGMTRLQLIEEVVKIAQDFPAILTDRITRTAAVYEVLLDRWLNNATFTAAQNEGRTIAVDMCVTGSTNMTRDEQEAKGWNNVDLEDLAVAALGYLAITGKNPFKDTEDFEHGHVVRVRGGAFFFYGDGMYFDDYYDAHRSDDVAASAALPCQNLKS